MNEKYIVTGYVEDIDGIFHTFQSDYDVHICSNGPLIAMDGTEYFIEEYLGGSSNKVLVGLLTDHNVKLPVGMVLTAGKEPWRQEIPNSEIVSVSYDTYNADIVEMENNPFYVPYSLHTVIDINQGSHLEIKSDYRDYKSREEISFLKNDGITELLSKFDELLRDAHSYRGIPVDDTGRRLLVHYKSGETLKYDGVIYNENYNSATLLKDFLMLRYGQRHIYT